MTTRVDTHHVQVSMRVGVGAEGLYFALKRDRERQTMVQRSCQHVIDVKQGIAESREIKLVGVINNYSLIQKMKLEQMA